MKKLVAVCISIILVLSLYIMHLKRDYNNLIYNNVDKSNVINCYQQKFRCPNHDVRN